MKQTCKFCKERDIRETIPSLSIDLFQAVESGVVLDTGTIEEYNKIDSPDCVHTRVRDVFHAIELQKSYLSLGKVSTSNSVGSSEHASASVSESTSSAGAQSQTE